jgi:Flp pilus assembly protein TadG
MRRRLFKFRADASGVSAVEFAMLAPVITMVFGLAVDGGLASNGQMGVEGASRAGADFASIHPTATSSQVAAVATASTNWSVSVSTQTYCGCAGTSGIVQQSCSVGTCSNGARAGAYYAVTATANYTPMFGSFWSAVVPYAATLSHTTVSRTS